MFFTYIGLYIPFFYITDYALSIGIEENMSFYNLIIMCAGSIPGRLLPPYFADKYVMRCFSFGDVVNCRKLMGPIGSEMST